MSLIQDFTISNPINETIDGVKKFFGLTDTQKQSILIDADVVPYSIDMVIYNSKNIELLRIRGEYAFSLDVNKQTSPTPSGKRLTKGITINDHSITCSNAQFTIKNEIIEDSDFKTATAVSKMSNLVGCLAPQLQPIISKGTVLLNNIYAIGNGANDIAKTANDFRDLLYNGTITSGQEMQTRLENLLLSDENGNYIITYCGKKYNRMACTSIHTNDSLHSLISVDLSFEYASENDTEIKKYGIKGFNLPADNSTIKAQSQEENEETWLKSIKNVLGKLF